ncbi:hypothetical protein WT49_17835 [Burkholderia territorii]|uniref:Uncharacterized protein n=2 Tax=Burkholderia territorii TaxID=1503055 RepID=A0A6L3NHM1_9BURK|nr:hypothetical protein [Burkholderia territorii]KAB0678646.1 hypothetical protein F7R13_12145 [Burkholderia territorii]KVL06022.1 hypothetical protein WS94_08855 [Burkholderia territorii]KVN42486.1 hypothetical protein WT12_27645 [Burkholderia territorii]KWE31855.1 hypothetical protein WT50_30240 [Burkholderia territorii]KWE33694.1 hypothetical protein WT49_17835 [Burkholderia territorii]
MPHCCPPRAAFIPASPSRAARRAASAAPRNARSAFAARCLRVIGWYRLERLLASIPDSNDDFGIV